MNYRNYLHWNIFDWSDPDARRLDIDFMIAVGAFSAVVLLLLIVGPLLGL